MEIQEKFATVLDLDLTGEYIAWKRHFIMNQE